MHTSNQPVPKTGFESRESDPAHLFMQIYDRLPAELFSGSEPMRWRDDRVAADRIDEIERVILRDGVARYEELAQIVAVPGWTEIRRLFTLLVGVDHALWYANPFSGTSNQRGLTAVARRYARTGQFNDPRVVPGFLLPRCTMPGRPLGSGEREDFFSVHRVPPGDGAGFVDYDRVLLRHEPWFNRDEPVKIACVPFIETYKEMGLALNDTGASPSYRVDPVGSPDMWERVTALLEKMDASGARIGVVPESCLSEEILERWTAAAYETYERGKPLRWLLLGSGPLGNQEPPVNRTVLIDRVTRDTILEYDKRHRFTLDSRQIEEWALPFKGLEQVREHIRCGDRVVIRESSLGRLAAIICEDLSRSVDWEREFAAFGVSHLLVPEFSKPIMRDHWEHKVADRQVEQLGAWIVVSNSLAVGNESGCGSADDAYTCLVFGPGDPDRRQWATVRQFGRAKAVDDVGWVQTDDGREDLPTVLAGALNPSWFGG